MFKENLGANIGQIVIRLITMVCVCITIYLFILEKVDDELLWHYFFAFIPLFVFLETVCNLCLRNDRDII